MVGASALACSGDFLLRLAGCQRQDLVAEVRRTALATSGFCSCRGRAPASTRASASLIRCFSLVISSNVDILYLRGRVLVDPDRSIFWASTTTMHTVQQQNVRIYLNQRAVVGDGPQVCQRTR